MIWMVTHRKETREAIVPLIRAKGYETAEMDCSDEVIKRARFAQPKTIILDCSLTDSFELLGKLKADPVSMHTPVIVFCINDGDLKERALLKGAESYVPKGSLDWAELLVEVVRLAGPPKKA